MVKKQIDRYSAKVLCKSLFNICRTRKIDLKMSFITITHVIEQSLQGREFHNNCTAIANARSAGMALDFTNGITWSYLLEPLHIVARSLIGSQGASGWLILLTP